MRIKKLEIAYKLTGNGITPCEVSPPYTINHALSEAGLLTDRFSGMGALEGEWAYNRAFALEGVFSLDGWDSERTYLEFEWLLGSGCVYVNGERAGEFAGGPLTLDITGCAAAGVNSLRVEFSPGEVRGIMGETALRGCWSLHVRGFALTARDYGIDAAVTVSAHAAGRYVFRYAVSRADEALDTLEFEEQLGARTGALTHALHTGAPEQFGSGRPALHVRLTVLRAGDACDERAGCVAGAPGDSPLRTVAVTDGECAGQRLGMLLDAGARRFIVRAGTFLPEEFLRRADEAGAEVYAQCAPPAPHACLCGKSPDIELTRFAGMRLLDPPARPMPEIALRALGGGAVLDMRPGELLGGCMPGDIARLSRVMRYLQAQQIACAVEADSEAAFDLGGGYGQAASYDLFDSGKPRPAYFALAAAWREHGVYALPGGIAFDPGEAVSVPVFARGGGFERVRAELYDGAGNVLSRAEFVCGGEGKVGELMFVLGRECAAQLLRLTGWHADGQCVRDYPILIRGAHELEALVRLAPARIKREGDEYVNVAEVIAFGPMREDGGGALLPGERRRLHSAEGVNVFEYAALNE